jgi:tetratricopeptide (TPR) repeat protein
MLGDILQTEKKYAAAEDAYRAGLAIYAKTAVDLPGEPPNRADVAECRRGLAITLAALGRTVEAAETFRQLAIDHLREAARPSKETVEFAQRATELAPKDPKSWSLLASAQYRLADWKAVAAAAKKAIELPDGGTSGNEFLLAIAEWQLSNKSESRKWYDKAVASMPKAAADDGEINGLRAELEKLLGQ